MATAIPLPLLPINYASCAPLVSTEGIKRLFKVVPPDIGLLCEMLCFESCFVLCLILFSGIFK